MLRNGRPVEPHFTPEELLYRACPPEAAPPPGGRPNIGAFRLPELSVNRSAFSEPEDCRHPKRQDHWVLAFPVDAVPVSVKSEGPTGQEYPIAVVHDPEDDNYAHSLVRIFKHSGELLIHQNDVPKTVKAKIRQSLADASVTVLEPSASFDEQGA